MTADCNGLFQSIINIQDKLKQLEVRLSTLPINKPNSSVLQSSISSTNPLVRNQRQDPFPMPELPLIKFSGDPKEWPSFWD